MPEDAYWLIPAYCAMLGVAVTASITDWRTGLVPNRLTYPTALIAVVFWSLSGFFSGPATGLDAMLGLGAGLVPMMIIFTLGGLGGGDVKLMACVGAWSATWTVVLSTVVYAMLVALVMAIVIMIAKGAVRQTFNRLLGALLSKTAGGEADLPKDGLTVPFALAITIGFAIAGAEQMLGWHSPWAWLSP